MFFFGFECSTSKTHEIIENVLLICFFLVTIKGIENSSLSTDICTDYNLKKSFSFEQKIFSNECSIVKNSQVNVYFQPI